MFTVTVFNIGLKRTDFSTVCFFRLYCTTNLSSQQLCQVKLFQKAQSPACFRLLCCFVFDDSRKFQCSGLCCNFIHCFDSEVFVKSRRILTHSLAMQRQTYFQLVSFNYSVIPPYIVCLHSVVSPNVFMTITQSFNLKVDTQQNHFPLS